MRPEECDCELRCGVGRRRRFEETSWSEEGRDVRRSSWRSVKVDARLGSWTRGLALSSLRASSSASGCGDHSWAPSGRIFLGTGEADGEKSKGRLSARAEWRLLSDAAELDMRRDE